MRYAIRGVLGIESLSLFSRARRGRSRPYVKPVYLRRHENQTIRVYVYIAILNEFPRTRETPCAQTYDSSAAFASPFIDSSISIARRNVRGAYATANGINARNYCPTRTLTSLNGIIGGSMKRNLIAVLPPLAYVSLCL